MLASRVVEAGKDELMTRVAPAGISVYYRRQNRLAPTFQSMLKMTFNKYLDGLENLEDSHVGDVNVAVSLSGSGYLPNIKFSPSSVQILSTLHHVHLNLGVDEATQNLLTNLLKTSIFTCTYNVDPHILKHVRIFFHDGTYYLACQSFFCPVFGPKTVLNEAVSTSFP